MSLTENDIHPDIRPVLDAVRDLPPRRALWALAVATRLLQQRLPPSPKLVFRRTRKADPLLPTPKKKAPKKYPQWSL